MKTMKKMTIIWGLLLSAIIAYVQPAYAQMAQEQGSMNAHMQAGPDAAIEAGNKFCPVSGEKIGEMGTAVKHEYNGKIYSLCCEGCIAIFKEDPDAYSKIAEESMKEN